jgi:hypothetical protein
MGFKELLQPQASVGMSVSFDSDKYSDWGPSEGHKVSNVDGKKLTICRDSNSYNDTNPDTSDVIHIDLSKTVHSIDEVKNKIEFD